MIVSASPALRIILYEGLGSRPLEGAMRLAILRTLLEKGYAVSCVRAGGTVSAAFTGQLVVLGQFLEPRPAQAEDADRGVHLYFRAIDDLDSTQVIALVESIGRELNVAPPGGWKPWFPVIDYQRCTNCMQCLSFCLFDVYGVQDGKIKVQNENKCKTDCPACSRVCPEVAILFPKYRHGPINGDVISADDVRREAMKVDISALLGGDIYAMLRDRSTKAKSRFSKERDEERALKERQRCLAKLQEKLEIPPEVLQSLPSLDEIQAKAAAAKARGEAARKETQTTGKEP